MAGTADGVRIEPGTKREVWLVEEDRFLAHAPPGEHAERPGRYPAVQRGLSAAGDLVEYRRLASHVATDEELLLGHTEEHLERVTAAVAANAFLDEDTYTCDTSEEVARLAVGASIDLCAAVLERGSPEVGFAAVRPPGHHAERSRAMGFCLFSNVALAALEMRRRGLVERVAVVDWDVHHGNGTEHVLWEEPDLFFLSLHQHPLYPGTGALGDTGSGEGEGWNLNLPLPSGARDADVIELFDRVVVPVLHRVDPDLVIISAGYDAHVRDPLASLALTGVGFGLMTQRLRSLEVPCAAILEGGYDLQGLAEGVTATVRGLAGSFPAEVEATAARWVDELVGAARSQFESHWGPLID